MKTTESGRGQGEISGDRGNASARRSLWQAVKFTLFSASAGLIQIGTYALFYEAFRWAPWLSYLVSLILSVLWNFTFNRTYTFRSDADVKRSMLLVGLFYLVFTPLSTWWTAALTGENPFTGAAASRTPLVNNYVVQAATMLINFVTEFLYQKFVVYRGTEDTNERGRAARETDFVRESRQRERLQNRHPDRMADVNLCSQRRRKPGELKKIKANKEKHEGLY